MASCWGAPRANYSTQQQTKNSQLQWRGIQRGGVMSGRRGKARYHCFWGSEWNDKKINNKKYTVAYSDLRSKKIAQQPTKNGWARGKRGWKGGMSVGEWQRDADAPHLCVEGERGNVPHRWRSHDAGSWCWAPRPQYGDDGLQNSWQAGPNIF
jgi:hypothetical protein